MVALAFGAAAEQVERRLVIDNIGDIFNGFIGDGFFLCNDGTDEPVEFFTYFLYLIGGLIFGGEGGEFLGKTPGPCDNGTA